MKFNKEYAPDGWDYNEGGEPDVVFMARTLEVKDDDARKSASRSKDQFESPKRAENYYEAGRWDDAKTDSRRRVDSSDATQQRQGADATAGESRDKSGGSNRGSVGFATEGQPDNDGNVKLKNGLKIPRDQLP